MSAMELASRDLNAWREKKSEEFNKAKFLDVGERFYWVDQEECR